MSRLLLPAFVLSVAASSPVFAQQWAEKMFNKLEHNFGTVARGSDTVYRFEVTNLYKQDMHITGVRSSCGCTTPSIENPDIKSHEKAYIVARFNTSSHLGRKGATLTVSFGAPHPAEVQVRVHGYIRGDVQIDPGLVQLGTVDEGTSKEQIVRVNYQGQQAWQITDVTNDNDYFEVEVKSANRHYGRVDYDLLVRLKDDVPPGYIKDQIMLVTNDPNTESRRIPLVIEGRVVPEISVTPSSVYLGELKMGESVTKKLVVRGKTPFRIIGIDCGGNQCFSFKKDDTAKTIHLVEVTFQPQKALGKMQQSITIRTEGSKTSTASCLISANVLPGQQQTTTAFRGVEKLADAVID